MKVFLKSLTGKGMYLDVDPNSTVRSLMDKSGRFKILDKNLNSKLMLYPDSGISMDEEIVLGDMIWSYNKAEL